MSTKQGQTGQAADELSPDRCEDMLEQARWPGVFLRKTAHADGPGTPGCWLGGEPTLPAELDWPWYETEQGYSVPMHFLAQIDLAEVAHSGDFPGLLEAGTLFFFHDPIYAPVLGFRDGGSKTFFVERSVAGCSPRTMPDIPSELDERMFSFYYAQRRTKGHRKWALQLESHDFVDEHAFLDDEFWQAALKRRVESFDELKAVTATDRFPSKAKRWSDLDGWSQNFAPHRMLAGSTYPDAFEAPDFVPLLTVVSDADIGFQHGDHEDAVFWISCADLQEGNFDAVFLRTGL